MLKKVEDYLKKAPAGTLKYKQVKGKTYFYQQFSDGKVVQKYIKRRNESLAYSLAQKAYYQKVKTLLVKQIDELTAFIDTYKPKEVEMVYDELPRIRKQMIAPLRISIAEKIRRWNDETYEPNNNHPEGKIYETEQGEFVRSKSEVIIANMLYRNKKDILYKYERPIRMIAEGKEIVVYPDFTILNKHTGKIIYLEHIGRLDDSYYANDFVRKVNTYVENDLIPGRDVVFTYESSRHPLDMRVLKKIVGELIL